MGGPLCPHHLSPGVSDLRALPDHDAKGSGRDLEDGPVDALQLSTPGHHPGAYRTQDPGLGDPRCRRDRLL